MASSPVDIANLALGHVNGGFITNLNSSSPEGSRIRVFYDTARKVELEAFNWSFARKHTQLSETEGYVQGDIDGWLYSFDLPEDFLVARVIPQGNAAQFNAVPFFDADRRFDGVRVPRRKDAEPYTIIGTKLYANGSEGVEEVDGNTVLNLIYTFDNISVPDYTSNFVMALSHRLASYIAADPGVKEMQTLLADRHRLLAQGTDGNTGFSPRPEPDAVWVSARN